MLQYLRVSLCFSLSKCETEAYELRTFPKIACHKLFFLARTILVVPTETEWKSPRTGGGGAERKCERVRVDKVNGHFVKFAEQETTRITARASRRFLSLSLSLPLFCGLLAKIIERTDATCSLSSSHITADLIQTFDRLQVCQCKISFPWKSNIVSRKSTFCSKDFIFCLIQFRFQNFQNSSELKFIMYLHVQLRSTGHYVKAHRTV